MKNACQDLTSGTATRTPPYQTAEVKGRRPRLGGTATLPGKGQRPLRASRATPLGVFDPLVRKDAALRRYLPIAFVALTEQKKGKFFQEPRSHSADSAAPHRAGA